MRGLNPPAVVIRLNDGTGESGIGQKQIFYVWKPGYNQDPSAGRYKNEKNRLIVFPAAAVCVERLTTLQLFRNNIEIKAATRK
jgi:hypothetical protein